MDSDDSIILLKDFVKVLCELNSEMSLALAVKRLQTQAADIKELRIRVGNLELEHKKTVSKLDSTCEKLDRVSDKLDKVADYIREMVRQGKIG